MQKVYIRKRVINTKIALMFSFQIIPNYRKLRYIFLRIHIVALVLKSNKKL